MSRQLSNAKVESTRQPNLVLTKSVQKSIISSFFQPSQQKSAGYKFGSTPASKQTPSLDSEFENYYFKNSSQRAPKKQEAVEVARVISNEEDKEMTHHLQTSTFLNISKGIVDGFSELKGQMNKNLKDLESMSVGEQTCRKQLMQHHLSAIEAMELMELNEEPEIVKQAMDQLFQRNLVQPPSEIAVWNSKTTDASSSTAVFKFNDGTTLNIEPGLVKLSAGIAVKSNDEKKEVELTERFIGEAFNSFSKFFFPKHVGQLEKLEDSVDKEDFWMEFIADHQDATASVKGLYQDDLIRAGNAAAELEFPAFVHACAYVMAEQTENMKLKELREYLNEDYDFSDEIKAKIEACPEFPEL